MTVDPHIAAWALQRIRETPRLAAEMAVCQERLRTQCAHLTPAQRVLHAEPVSTFIGLTALISSIGVSTAIAGAIGGAIVGIGLSLGVNYAVSALTRRGQSSNMGNLAADLNSPAIKYNERQAIPAKRIPYGYNQQGGALCFEAVKPPYLYQQLLLSAEPIGGILKLWIGNSEILFAGLVPNQILTPLAVTGQPPYQDRLKISFRLGLPDQAMCPLLAQDFPELAASFRQRGTATLTLRYHYGADYTEFTRLWGQVQRPNPLVLTQGISVPDPRIPGHILNWNPLDPDSIAEARASWGFNNNASLVQSHYLTQRYGGKYRPSKINWDKVAYAAEFDDDVIGCKDGTFQKRYTIDGLITLNQPTALVMSGMISANRGFILTSAGKAWPSSSRPRKPVVTICDRLLTGAVDIRGDKPKRDLINRVKVRMIAPDREYQLVDGPVLKRPDLVAKDGELLAASLDLPFTLGHQRGQRIAKAFLETGRLGGEITVRCDVELLANAEEELIGEAIVWDSQLFPQANGIWFCKDWGFSEGYTSIDVSLTEYDPSIETNWIPARDEQDFTIEPLDLS